MVVDFTDYAGVYVGQLTFDPVATVTAMIHLRGEHMPEAVRGLRALEAAGFHDVGGVVHAHRPSDVVPVREHVTEPS
ncbi:hypothetical protein D3C81_2251140 [compost metagenome]